eukprot:50203-Rhodomonas_salina.2
MQIRHFLSVLRGCCGRLCMRLSVGNRWKPLSNSISKDSPHSNGRIGMRSRPLQAILPVACFRTILRSSQISGHHRYPGTQRLGGFPPGAMVNSLYQADLQKKSRFHPSVGTARRGQPVPGDSVKGYLGPPQPQLLPKLHPTTLSTLQHHP